MSSIFLCTAVVIAIILVATLLPYLSAGTAMADGDIFVQNDAYLNDYPNQIKFSLDVNSNSEIRRVFLYYTIEPSPVLTYAFPKFDPGTQVKVEYAWNTQRRYIPPGVELKYYWVIENAAGSKLKTDPQTFVVEDARFKWQKFNQGIVNLHWYRGDQGFADTLMSFAQDALVRLSQEDGIQISDPINIYIYASQRDLLGALEPKAQEWTGGRALPQQGIIVLNVEPSRSGLSWAARALPHELSHLVVGKVTENPYGDIPHWLDEGLAMHAEGELTGEFKQSLDAAVRDNTLISLQSLASNFPTDSDSAVLSYAESYSVVSFILKEYGPERMAALLSIFQDGSTYDDALQAALGVDLDGLEEQWRASLNLLPLEVSSTPVPAAAKSQEGQSGGGVCLGAGPALVLVAGVWLRRSRKPSPLSR